MDFFPNLSFFVGKIVISVSWKWGAIPAFQVNADLSLVPVPSKLIPVSGSPRMSFLDCFSPNNRRHLMGRISLSPRKEKSAIDRATSVRKLAVVTMGQKVFHFMNSRRKSSSGHANFVLLRLQWRNIRTSPPRFQRLPESYFAESFGGKADLVVA